MVNSETFEEQVSLSSRHSPLPKVFEHVSLKVSDQFPKLSNPRKSPRKKTNLITKWGQVFNLRPVSRSRGGKSNATE